MSAPRDTQFFEIRHFEIYGKLWMITSKPTKIVLIVLSILILGYIIGCFFPFQ